MYGSRRSSRASAETRRAERHHHARVLAVLGDSVTTDHMRCWIYSSGQSSRQLSHCPGRQAVRFNSYGARRGNHEVMMRGTFANTACAINSPRTEGGWTVSTRRRADDDLRRLDRYQAAGVPLLVLAGKETDRARLAIGPRRVRCFWVYARSSPKASSGFTAATWSNRGVCAPVRGRSSAASLGLMGTESYDTPLPAMTPRATITVVCGRAPANRAIFRPLWRIDTPEELTAFRHGGILPLCFETIVDKTN